METFTQTLTLPIIGTIIKWSSRVVRRSFSESWEAANKIWFQWAGMKAIQSIEVCDIKRHKPQGSNEVECNPKDPITILRLISELEGSSYFLKELDEEDYNTIREMVKKYYKSIFK